MDPIIKRFDSVIDGDLTLCEHRGVAYQTDMSRRRGYLDDYYKKVSAYEGSDIAKAVNFGRLKFMLDHVTTDAKVLDYGCGTGDFMRAAKTLGFDCSGFEVMPVMAASLIKQGLYVKSPKTFAAVCLWDVIEHLESPDTVLREIGRNRFLFVSLPIFDDLTRIRESKHYRPGEHLYYWTAYGFERWMQGYGFRLVGSSDHEVVAGRDSIGAFAFVKDYPDFHGHVAAYKEMHATRYYGGSATELYLEKVGAVVREFSPASILDYGCGRSDLVSHFWRDGKRHIAKYDPAIPAFEVMPEGQFDLGLCCDVMEHIPIGSVDRILSHLRSKTSRAVFTISMKPARAKLPDGRNSHVTILTRSEWTRWVGSYWGRVQERPSGWDHELFLIAEA